MDDEQLPHLMHLVDSLQLRSPCELLLMYKVELHISFNFSGLSIFIGVMQQQNKRQLANKLRMIVSGSNIKLASDLLRYVLFQPFTDDKRENLRQDLIDKRRMRSINKIRDYNGDNIDFTEEDNGSKKIYNCDLKLPETV